MSSHSCTIVSFQANFSGAYSEGGFTVSQNEIRARYVSNADSRFGGGASLQLPKLDEEGNVVVAQVQLTAEQVTAIQNVLESAMQSTQYEGCDFGVAPPAPSE